MKTPSVLIKKMHVKEQPTLRPNGTRILANFEFVAAGINIRHCQIVVNQHGFVVVWYPCVRDEVKEATRAVVIDDQDLHRNITTAARAAYLAMGGEHMPAAVMVDGETYSSNSHAPLPDRLPAFLTTPTPLPAGDHDHG